MSKLRSTEWLSRKKKSGNGTPIERPGGTKNSRPKLTAVIAEHRLALTRLIRSFLFAMHAIADLGAIPTGLAHNHTDRVAVAANPLDRKRTA